MSWLPRLGPAIFGVVLLAVLSATGALALQTRGLWVQFERRGWPSEYWTGQVFQKFNQFDSVVGHNVSDEVALQLDAMRGMGVNTISVELRTADQDGIYAYPTCHMDPALGLQWPQPTATELANLVPFFDLVQSKGMKIILVLVNTHLELQPPTDSQTWLGAILNVVKNHPALYAVVFNGTPNAVDTDGDGTLDACGIPAEPGLWLGAGAVPAVYLKWAIGYAMSLGLPASKLSAGTIVGDFFTDSEPPAGSGATDGHLWKPVGVLKTIFDSLSIPTNQRLYTLSFYEHSKCSTARGLPCTDADPPTWADHTIEDVNSVIGANNGARVVAYEMGNLAVDPDWSASNTLANLVAVLSKYNAEGGSFWRWANFSNSEDSNSTLAQPIKIRGTAFNYTPVQTILVDMYKPSHGFTGNGASDILWHHSNGSTSIWQVSGSSHTALNLGVINTAWQIAGTASQVSSTGDVDGDGKADIFWRHTNGSLSIWLMNGGTSHTPLNLGTVDNAWQIAGVGDFDGDGHADILWRHTNGSLSIWKMSANGTHTALNFGVIDNAWQVAGIGDVNHDGKADIIWRHTNGSLSIWEMNSGTSHTPISVGTVATAWQIVGVGDIDGDGNADIFWRHTDGSLSIWKMNGGAHTAVSLGTVATAWQIVSIGDYNGDGRADILWRHTNGSASIWTMNANGTHAALNLGTVATAWTVVE